MSASVNFTKKGKKNRTSNKEFVKICKMSQMGLKEYLTEWLISQYKEVVSGDGFVYARGDFPILVTAHMDTVHKEKVKDFYEFTDKANGNRHIISSPQGIGGDDRCGVYMIKQIVKSGLKPYILFCEDEEVGGIGSDKFVKTTFLEELKEMFFLVELDRAHKNDVVYYDDGNEEFHKYVEGITGYKSDWGSFSDISTLSPACGVSSVNISCGYYNAHTTDEYVVLEEMENSIKQTIKLIKQGIVDNKQYQYKEEVFRTRYKWFWDDYNYDYASWNRSFTSKATETKTSSKVKSYVFFDYDGFEYVSSGNSVAEALGELMMEYTYLCFNDFADIMEESEYTEMMMSCTEPSVTEVERSLA